MSTRNVRHTAPGPVALTLNARYAEVDIITSTGDTARVELVPVDPGEETAARLIAETEVRHDDDKFTVVLPYVPSISIATYAVGGDRLGSHQVNTVIGNVYGNVYQSGSRSHSSGDVVHTAGIRVHATLPAGSKIDVDADSSGIRAKGQYAKARAHTKSGGVHVGIVHGEADLRSQNGSVSVDVAGTAKLNTQAGSIVVAHADEIDAETMNGGITVGEVVKRARLKSMNGGITVYSTHSPQVDAETMLGNITAHGKGIKLRANTMLGHVQHVD